MADQKDEARLKVFAGFENPARVLHGIAHATKPNNAEQYASASIRARGARMASAHGQVAEGVVAKFRAQPTTEAD